MNQLNSEKIFLVWRNNLAISQVREQIELSRIAWSEFIGIYNELELDNPLTLQDITKMLKTWEKSNSPAQVTENLLLTKIDIPETVIGKLKTDKRAMLRTFDLSATSALTRHIEQYKKQLFSYCENLLIENDQVSIDEIKFDEIAKIHSIYADSKLERTLFVLLDAFRQTVLALDHFTSRYDIHLKFNGFGWTDTGIFELLDHGEQNEVILNKDFYQRVASRFPRDDKVEAAT